jgi:hypothetical protein
LASVCANCETAATRTFEQKTIIGDNTLDVSTDSLPVSAKQIAQTIVGFGSGSKVSAMTEADLMDKQPPSITMEGISKVRASCRRSR